MSLVSFILESKLTADTTSFDSGMNASADTVDAAFSKMYQAGRRYLAATGLLMIIRKASAESRAFGQIMADLSAITEKSVDRMGHSLLKLDHVFGRPVRSGYTLYEAISSGIKGTEEELTQFVESAGKAAKVIRSEMFTVSNAMTTMMHSYKIATADSNKLVDAMYTMVKEGKIHGDEFARTAGLVINSASETGVSINELFASIALLSRTMTPSSSLISLNQMMNSFMGPTLEAKKAARELGLEISAEAVQAKGFANVLREVHEKVGGNVEAIKALFGNIRAARGALALTGKQFEDFIAILDEMEYSTGRGDAAFKKQTETTQAAAERMATAWNKALISVGSDLDIFQRIFYKTGTGVIDGLNNVGTAVSDFYKALGGDANGQAVQSIEKIEQALSGLWRYALYMGILSKFMSVMQISFKGAILHYTKMELSAKAYNEELKKQIALEKAANRGYLSKEGRLRAAEKAIRAVQSRDAAGAAGATPAAAPAPTRGTSEAAGQQMHLSTEEYRLGAEALQKSLKESAVSLKKLKTTSQAINEQLFNASRAIDDVRAEVGMFVKHTQTIDKGFRTVSAKAQEAGEALYRSMEATKGTATVMRGLAAALRKFEARMSTISARLREIEATAGTTAKAVIDTSRAMQRILTKITTSSVKMSESLVSISTAMQGVNSSLGRAVTSALKVNKDVFLLEARLEQLHRALSGNKPGPVTRTSRMTKGREEPPPAAPMTTTPVPPIVPPGGGQSGAMVAPIVLHEVTKSLNRNQAVLSIPSAVSSMGPTIQRGLASIMVQGPRIPEVLPPESLPSTGTRDSGFFLPGRISRIPADSRTSQDLRDGSFDTRAGYRPPYSPGGTRPPAATPTGLMKYDQTITNDLKNVSVSAQNLSKALVKSTPTPPVPFYLMRREVEEASKSLIPYRDGINDAQKAMRDMPLDIKGSMRALGRGIGGVIGKLGNALMWVGGGFSAAQFGWSIGKAIAEKFHFDESKFMKALADATLGRATGDTVEQERQVDAHNISMMSKGIERRIEAMITQGSMDVLDAERTRDRLVAALSKKREEALVDLTAIYERLRAVEEKHLAATNEYTGAVLALKNRTKDAEEEMKKYLAGLRDRDTTPKYDREQRKAILENLGRVSQDMTAKNVPKYVEVPPELRRGEVMTVNREVYIKRMERKIAENIQNELAAMMAEVGKEDAGRDTLRPHLKALLDKLTLEGQEAVMGAVNVSKAPLNPAVEAAKKAAYEENLTKTKANEMAGIALAGVKQLEEEMLRRATDDSMAEIMQENKTGIASSEVAAMKSKSKDVQASLAVYAFNGAMDSLLTLQESAAFAGLSEEAKNATTFTLRQQIVGYRDKAVAATEGAVNAGVKAVEAMADKTTADMEGRLATAIGTMDVGAMTADAYKRRYEIIRAREVQFAEDIKTLQDTETRDLAQRAEAYRSIAIQSMQKIIDQNKKLLSVPNVDTESKDTWEKQNRELEQEINALTPEKAMAALKKESALMQKVQEGRRQLSEYAIQSAEAYLAYFGAEKAVEGFKRESLDYRKDAGLITASDYLAKYSESLKTSIALLMRHGDTLTANTKDWMENEGEIQGLRLSLKKITKEANDTARALRDSAFGAVHGMVKDGKMDNTATHHAIQILGLMAGPRALARFTSPNIAYRDGQSMTSAQKAQSALAASMDSYLMSQKYAQANVGRTVAKIYDFISTNNAIVLR